MLRLVGPPTSIPASILRSIFRSFPASVLVWLGWVWLCCQALGCQAVGHARAPLGDDPSAWAAQLQDHLRRHPEDRKAQGELAQVRWAHLGQTDAALPTLDRLAHRGDPIARLSRLLLAEGRLEDEVAGAHAYALVREAASAAPDDPALALRQAAALVAARHIAGFHGERSGDDARFIRLFDGLDLTRLSSATRQTLLSVRAGIARAQGQDYSGFYQQQGCVQDWRVGPVTGVAGELELARVTGPFVPDPDAEVVKLACVVRLWNPTVRAGLRRMQTTLEVPGDLLELEVSAEEPVRVWLDGQLVHRTDLIHRFPRTRTVLQLPVQPGAHLLEVATPIPGDRAWVLVRATTPNGTPVGVRPVPLEDPPGGLGGPPQRLGSPWAGALAQPGSPVAGPLYGPLRTLLATEDGIHDGDVDAAEIRAGILAGFSGCAPCQFVRAQFERFDPSRGRTVSVAREQGALKAALRGDPTMDAARLRMLELMLGRGEERAVAQILAKLGPMRLHTVPGELLRTRVHLSLGDERRADEALARAVKQAPDNCHVLMTQRGRARARDDVAQEDRLVAAMAHCSGTLGLRADLARTRGRWDEARTLWQEALGRVPDDLDTLQDLAKLAMAAGERDEATAWLHRMLARNPLHLGARVALADLALAGGDPDQARGQLAQGLALAPHSDGLRTTASLVGIPDDMATLRVDGLAALADYRQSGVDYEGASEVLVLDRSAARVYANGGQRQIIHLVVELLSKAAIDRYGEMDIPEGARLLTLRTIKPDGRILEPESIPGKEGVSLRDLAVGDVVESEFLLEEGPATALPGYVDVSTFRFQSLDIPYHRSELLVVTPEALKLREDRRNGAPEAQVDAMVLGGERVTTRLYRALRVPRRGEEPGHRALIDELPNVRVYTPLDVGAYLDGLALQIRRGQRTNPELRQQAATLVRGAKTPRAKLEALWAWVVENVEDGGDLATPSTVTLAARSGSRLTLLRAMLREVGVHAELWLARDRFGPAPLPGGHPMIEEYSAAMLAVRLPEEADPIMVLTASKVMPLGYLSPSYARAPALRVHLDADDGPAGPLMLPGSRPGLEDRRSWTVEVDLAAAGTAEVRGQIVLHGIEAVAWRQALRDVDRDRVREVFQQAELGWLRGATLQRLDIGGEKNLDAPLTLKFAARAPEFGIRQGEALMVRADPLPLSTATRYTSLATRTTGMVIPYAPVLEADVTIRLAGAALVEVPPDAHIDGPFGRYTRRLRLGQVGGQQLRFEFHSQLRPGVVTPQEYGAFVGFAQAVETAEQAVVRVGG